MGFLYFRRDKGERRNGCLLDFWLIYAHLPHRKGNMLVGEQTNQWIYRRNQIENEWSLGEQIKMDFHICSQTAFTCCANIYKSLARKQIYCCRQLRTTMKMRSHWFQFLFFFVDLFIEALLFFACAAYSLPKQHIYFIYKLLHRVFIELREHFVR